MPACRERREADRIDPGSAGPRAAPIVVAPALRTRPPIDAATLLRASAWLLAAAAAVGAGLVGLRFGFDRPAPRWLRRVHGGFSASGLGVLGYAWAVVGVPRAGATALVLFAVAALGGIVTVRARRWRLPVSGEALAFGHLSIAAMGYVMLLVAVIGGRP